MDGTEFYRLISNKAVFSEDTLPQLASLVDEYPYCPAFKMLYLKNLLFLNDARFESELNRLSVFIPDRRRLFVYLKGDAYNLQVQETEITDSSFSLIDAFLADHSDSSDSSVVDHSLLFQPSASSDYLFWSLSDQDSLVKKTEDTQLQHQDLIDSFIRKEEERPAGSRLSDMEESARKSTVEGSLPVVESESKSLDDSYFTETLAHIYVKQKRYEKALQIIKNLSLKYPEKNVYFADQIRFLEKLIINTKK